MNLADIVGGAGDEGGGTKGFKLGEGEGRRLAENQSPQVPAKAHGYLGPQDAAAHGTEHPQQGAKEHPPAGEENQGKVLGGNALIDNAGHQGGEGQVGIDPGQGDGNQQKNPQPVGPQFSKKFQHVGAHPSIGKLGGSGRIGSAIFSSSSKKSSPSSGVRRAKRLR